jgi:hypothetical protein
MSYEHSWRLDGITAHLNPASSASHWSCPSRHESTGRKGPTMAITFRCECGKQYRAKDEDAGHGMICMKCRRETFVPMVSVDLTINNPVSAANDPIAQIVVDEEPLGSTVGKSQPAQRFKTSTFRSLLARTHSARRIEGPASGSPEFSTFPPNRGCLPWLSLAQCTETCSPQRRGGGERFSRLRSSGRVSD